MTKDAVENLRALKIALGEILEGVAGTDLPALSQVRQSCNALHGEVQKEREETAHLRAGDVDVEPHKRAVKQRETELTNAIREQEAAAVQLGESLCVVLDRGGHVSLSGLTDAMEVRAALRSLRKEYEELEPKPDAGLWARGKAAAKRVVLSGKIVLQEGRTKDLLKAVVLRGHQEKVLESSCSGDTVSVLAKFEKATQAVAESKVARDSAAAVLSDVEKRMRAVELSDKRVAAIESRIASKREECAQTLIRIVEDKGVDGLPEQVVAVLEKVSDAMESAEIAAAARGKQSKGLFGAIAKALSHPCPSCKKTGFVKIKTKLIGEGTFEGPAWRLPDGNVVEPNVLGAFGNVPKVHVTATYRSWLNEVSYACPACGHKEVRKIVGKGLMPPKAIG